MGNPVLVEALRGDRVESRHRGSAVVVDADGGIVLSLGDVERAVFPRSSVKALQALVLMETGAADRYGLSDTELALACASHSGEPKHVATAQSMLARAGLDVAALRCGSHPPMHQPSAWALARAGGQPSALHNNCSGKHAGFLCAACAIGADPRTYIEASHPVQRAVKAVLESASGVVLSEGDRATDGCSVPTWAVPLKALALAFARFGTGHTFAPERAKAAARLRAACANHPWYVAGTGRTCTDLMGMLGERAFVKVGAEGVYCAALPVPGLGIALKCDDGAGRAAEVVIAALIARFGDVKPMERAALDRFIRPALLNWNGMTVGALRPTAELSPSKG